MSPTKSFVALTAALGLLGSVGNAFAQTSSTCATDADCQHGYTCQVTAIVYGTTPACPPDSPCATAGAGGSTVGAAPHDVKDGGTPVPTGDSGIAAGAGGSPGSGDTPATDGGTSDPGSTTITSTISTCVPGPCTADGDCAAGMICHGQTVTTCSGSGATPPCESGTKCDTSGVVTESTCTSQTVSTCTFKWALPCNVNEDCGDGFFCQPSIGGACSGGSGVGGETGGGTSGSASSGSQTTGNAGDIELLADTCTTTMTYPGSCQSLVVACRADTDCPSTWICQSNLVPGAGTGGSTGMSPASDGGVASTSSSGVAPSGGAADVAPPLNTAMCVAPYSSPIGAKDGDGGRSGSAPSSGTASGTGGALPPMTTSGGSGGSNGAHAGTDTKVVSGDDAGGCSVVPANGSSGSSGAGLLAFAGLALLVARRRRS